MNIRLYGDGVHDDAPAIQAMLDERRTEVCLPIPGKNYAIGSTLKIHGGQTLKLSPFTVVRLLPDVNAPMLEDDDFTVFKENICIDGGIWDFNNTEQEPNPYHFPGKDGLRFQDRMAKLGYEAVGSSYPALTSFLPLYLGSCMRFCRIRNFTLRNITLRNPVTFGVDMGYIENFTVENITFDYTRGNPKLWNMDGIHIEGNCKFGYVHNLKGACHDDLVAITADDGLYGPIKNIVVDGIYAEHCHSAVRLLSHGLPVENIHITNVYGSFYVYCIGLTKYHGPEEERGYMKNISIDHVNACTCHGTADVGGGGFPFIWVQKGVDVVNLNISDVEREEKTYTNPMIKIDEGATVRTMVLENVHQTSRLGREIDLFVRDGDVTELRSENVTNR